MRGSSLRLLIILTLGLTLCLPAMAMANLVTNGGFETGAFTGWDAIIAPDCPDPYTFIVWGGIGHTGNYGAWFGAMGPSDYDTLKQTISTVAGQSYSLDFWLYHGYGANGTQNDFKASWNGVALLTNLSNSQSFGWREYTFTVVAAGPTSTFEFAGRDVPGSYVLDDVSVNAVPLPASVLLLGSGLVGLGLLGRRRKSS